MDPSRGYAEPQQQPVRGYKKAAADGTESKAQPKAAAKQHLPTVVHQDDPYRQQQLQQQQVLNALSNPNALGNAVLGNVALSNALLGNAALGNAGLGNAMLGSAVLGNAGVGNSLLANAALGSSGYGGANKQPNNPAGYSTSKVAGEGCVVTCSGHYSASSAVGCTCQGSRVKGQESTSQGLDLCHHCAQEASATSFGATQQHDHVPATTTITCHSTLDALRCSVMPAVCCGADVSVLCCGVHVYCSLFCALMRVAKDSEAQLWWKDHQQVQQQQQSGQKQSTALDKLGE
jgi:uncharacterized protein YjbI with pentapeptide repeats